MNHVPTDTLRADFSSAMSTMYKAEVPLYGDLIDLVIDINNNVLSDNPGLKESLQSGNNFDRIAHERHGAIRLGTEHELLTMRRLFAVMDMHPVGYYDLSIAGIPVHSTAFRPIEKKALSSNPFRIFTSLLRIELIEDNTLRQQAESLLATRKIFSDSLLILIDKAEQQGGLNDVDANDFIRHAVDVFRWHDKASVDSELYEQLQSQHRLIADVVSFKGPHINHLTPATLDIDQAQYIMPQRGITPKAVVEGPPKRHCPILLRQTSFKALEENVKFLKASGGYEAGSHTARFGEIEQRGIALTPEGQALYDKLLTLTRQKILPKADGSNAQQYMAALETEFTQFPDTYNELRIKKLAYFYYSLNDPAVQREQGLGMNLEQLITHGHVAYTPIIYEDFLPVSAAGIFQSNLGDKDTQHFTTHSNQSSFEKALGSPVIDFFQLYQQQESDSIQKCLDFFQ